MATVEVCSHSATGPSTSINNAAPTSGQSSPVAALAATMASVSIISIAAGTIPDSMMALTAFPASVVEGKVAKKVRVASGLRSIRSTTSVTMASNPSLPTTTPVKSYPGGSATAPPMSATLPSESTIRRPSTWLTVKPYFRQCAPPEFSATFPPMLQTDCEEGSGA